MILSSKNCEYIELVANEARGKIDELAHRIVLSFEDAEKYVEHFGGKVVHRPKLNSSIIRTSEENSFVIYVKEKSAEETLHELGHAFLHWEKIPIESNKSGSVDIGLENTGSVIDAREQAANYFMRVFLMPTTKFIDEVLAKTYNNICDFNELSQTFQVSKYLIVSRGKDLGIW